MNDAEGLLTLGEVAGALHKHPRTVRLWVEEGVLKAYRFPTRRGLYFKWADVLAAMEQVKPKTEAEA